MPTDSTTDLFLPVRLGSLWLPNRIVMAPLTRNRAPEGLVGELHARYYRQRAGAGMILTEATVIAPEGVGYPNVPGLHSDAQVAAWREVVEAVHEQGGRMFAQLWHVGRISLPRYQPEGRLPVAPSAIRPAGEAFTLEGGAPYETPRALELDEIPAVVNQYATAAANALTAGFDGVEIHGANGYLIDQFLRDGSNRRTDHYGGSIENRCRFLEEIVEAVTAVVEAGRVGVRLSPTGAFNDMHDSDPQALFDHLATRLAGRGLAYLHVVEQFPGDEAVPFDFASLRRRFDGAYIVNGGYDRARALQARAEDSADLVCFGRPYIANPDLVHRLALDAPLNPPDADTFYGGDAQGYTDYPTLDQQRPAPYASR